MRRHLACFSVLSQARLNFFFKKKNNAPFVLSLKDILDDLPIRSDSDWRCVETQKDLKSHTYATEDEQFLPACRTVTDQQSENTKAALARGPVHPKRPKGRPAKLGLKDDGVRDPVLARKEATQRFKQNVAHQQQQLRLLQDWMQHAPRTLTARVGECIAQRLPPETMETMQPCLDEIFAQLQIKFAELGAARPSS